MKDPVFQMLRMEVGIGDEHAACEFPVSAPQAQYPGQVLRIMDEMYAKVRAKIEEKLNV